MANTEGMPDEFVESLMTTTPASTASKRPTTTQSRVASSSLSAAERQRKRLQERMEMPVPQGGPAARIIRPSPQSRQREEEEAMRDENDNVGMADADDDAHQPMVDEATPASASILGNVLERTPTSSTLRKAPRAGKKQSRFAAAQQNKSLNGFPSVHVPLGTFCQPNKSKAKNTAGLSNNDGPRPVKVASKVVKRGAPSSAIPTLSSKADTITTESMLEAARRDAEGMIQGMTPEEIKEQQQELTAALSPDLVAFIKRRGAKGQKRTETEDAPSTDVATQSILPKHNAQEEKHRIAEVISKVQTHQDLDQAYHAIMQEPHPLENDKDGESHPIGGNEKNDFPLACDLLRSTNPRQTLWAARVVHQQLSMYLQQQQQTGVPVFRDWPLVLPVSLRCLLDQSVQANTGYILHTYVLQSLHSLLLLTAHPDHIVRVHPSDPPNAAELFSGFYLDDAIPTPRLDAAYSATPVKPLTTTEDKENNKTDSQAAAAYDTQSSSTSAQSDGEAFDRDPMWCILSKMKIVPRLAQLLAMTSGVALDWPQEAWISSIGIFAMIAQRSPGAASAIVHHEVILPRLIARVLPCLQDQDEADSTTDSGFTIAFALFRLLGTLARQSRVAAQSIPLVDLLPPLLARTPGIDLEFRVQQSGLALWRIALRYGLGLEALESMTTASARHLALPYTHRYSLSADFVSAMTQVLECAKFAKLKGTDLGKVFNKDSNGKLSIETVLSTLSLASTYLATTQRTVVLLPTTTIDSSSVDNSEECLRYRWNAARLRFLTNYWNLAEIHGAGNTEDETKSEEWSMEQVLTCLEAMEEWTEAGGLVELAWSHLSIYASCTDIQCGENDTMGREAAASAFLEAFVQLLLSLATSPNTTGNRMVLELTRSVSKHVLERILQGLRDASHQAPQTSSMSSRPAPLAQRGWINQCHFAAFKVFSHCLAIGEIQSSSDLHLIRMMVFNVLGRLERGNEAIAAVLFSQDVLFQAKGNPLDMGDESDNLPAGVNSASSPISSLFLSELCGSEFARKQLDHSFKLQHGFGVTKDGLGAFALDSLLSDADNQPKSPSSPFSADLSLPLGKLWLWQGLSGQIRIKEEGAVAQGFDEATNVVAAILGLLMELEDGDDLMDSSMAAGYSARIPLGAKLYYLMNVCLHTESVLRDDRVLDMAEALLERYWPRLKPFASIAEFSQACLQHTDPSKTKQDEVLEDKDKKLLELFNPEIPNEVSLSSEEMRSLEAFVDDMAEAYNDYGAQYDFFTKCMRLFLLPIFPSAIRCRTLRAIRGILHLLTLPTEVERPEELRVLLTHSVVPGGTAERDQPEFLDALTAIMVPNSGPRPLMGFVLMYSVAIMARNVSLALDAGEGLDGMKQRLIQMGRDAIELICRTTTELVGSSGSRDELVNATVKSLTFTDPAMQGGSELLKPHELDKLFEQLRSQVRRNE